MAATNLFHHKCELERFRHCQTNQSSLYFHNLRSPGSYWKGHWEKLYKTRWTYRLKHQSVFESKSNALLIQNGFQICDNCCYGFGLGCRSGCHIGSSRRKYWQFEKRNCELILVEAFRKCFHATRILHHLDLESIDSKNTTNCQYIRRILFKIEKSNKIIRKINLFECRKKEKPIQISAVFYGLLPVLPAIANALTSSFVTSLTVFAFLTSAINASGRRGWSCSMKQTNESHWIITQTEGLLTGIFVTESVGAGLRSNTRSGIAQIWAAFTASGSTFMVLEAFWSALRVLRIRRTIPANCMKTIQFDQMADDGRCWYSLASAIARKPISNAISTSTFAAAGNEQSVKSWSWKHHKNRTIFAQSVVFFANFTNKKKIWIPFFLQTHSPIVDLLR